MEVVSSAESQGFCAQIVFGVVQSSFQGGFKRKLPKAGSGAGDRTWAS